jgi:hypothetical protein
MAASARIVTELGVDQPHALRLVQQLVRTVSYSC